MNSVHGKGKERGVILSLENNIIRKFYEVIWSLNELKKNSATRELRKPPHLLG